MRLLGVGLACGLFAFVACGGSERSKERTPSSTGGASTGGTAGATAAASGLGGVSGSGAGLGGLAGGGVAGASVAGSGGMSGSTTDGGEAGEGTEGGAGGEGGGPTATANKLDVLFVIDNSISMFEKQGVLAQAVPTLVRRLVDPYCVYDDSTTGPATNGVCPPNTVREIAPVRDMHVGVITSSLGAHGGTTVCVPSTTDPRPVNDRAHLMGTARTGLSSWNDSGFLNWDPDGRATPVGETNVESFTSALQAMIAAAGDKGCGFEAPLEAMYRFLVDPEPPLDITNDGTFTVLTGVDTTLLGQREAFLRPDSAVLVVMLSDEDDCSIVEEPTKQGFLVGNTGFRMPRGSEACAHPEDPNVYRCCIPCVLLDSPGFVPNAGCSYTADAACTSSAGHSLSPAEDSVNLRCFHQRQRFGMDFLYPVDRYVTGLGATEIRNRAGAVVPNPLFASGRSPELVVLTTIVGVPWQDLVIETENFDGYELMTAKELRDHGRFPVILGDFATGVPPTDPFMIDSVGARSGRNPLTNDPIQPPDATSKNAINGHEQLVVNGDDLQYACTFELPEPIPCTATNQDGCDCSASEQAYSRPLCEYPAANVDGTQVFAKAYPGRRELEVARRLRDQAVISSICPRTLEDTNHPSYGYVPAMRAIQRNLRRILTP